MKDDIQAFLYDILQAAEALREFTIEKSFPDYVSSEMLRSAVERKFEIIGEAMARIKREDPKVVNCIRNSRDFISFRNILIHGYDRIDDTIVWDVLDEDLCLLIEDVRKLLPDDHLQSP